MMSTVPVACAVITAMSSPVHCGHLGDRCATERADAVVRTSLARAERIVRAAMHSSLTGSGPTVIPMRLLVVDDDPDVRDSLRRSLEFEGYEVTTAADGAEALTRL